MFDSKFWEEIKTTYPEAYDEFIKTTYFIEDFNGYPWLIKRSQSGRILSQKDICYCNIETYFDGLGIIINSNFPEYYKIISQNKNNLRCTDYIECNNSRPNAKSAAAKKAFEIRENLLKEVK